MKKILLLLVMLLTVGAERVLAQNRRVNGRVLDETGQGLPGAAVGAKGSNLGVATDVDGNFSFEIPESITTLVIRAAGYKTQEVPVGEGAVNVRMEVAAKSLDETIITANAIRREKRSVGYATTQITGNEITSGGNSSPLNALVGKTAGANITTTANTPGSSSRIVLRGGSSISGNNQALLVVDGVIINNQNYGTGGDLGNLSNQVDYGNRGNDINPDDIESVNVLKGPAATALYGSLGSNGALIITTKKGARKGTGRKKTDIEFSTSYALSSVLKLPEFQNSYGQGNIYEGIYDDRRENFSWGEKFNGENRPWGQLINGQQRVKPYSALPNNVRDFFDIGKTWNNSVAINGGNEQSAFRLSLNSINSSSVFPGKTYDKYNIGFNGNANLTNNLYASVNFNYSKVNSNVPSFGQGGASVMDNLLQTPRDIPITEGKDLNNPFNSMDYVDATGTHRYGFYGAYAENPYYTLSQYRNENRVDRLYGNFIVGTPITKWLKIENRLATDLYSDRRYQKWPKYTSIAADGTGLYDGNDPHSALGRYAEDIYNVSNIYNDLMLNINKDFGKDFVLTAQLGHNFTQNRLQNTYASTNEEGGLIVPDAYFLGNSNGKLLGTSNLTLVRKTGLYADINIGFRNMIFLGITGRSDRSSTIQNGSKPYFYNGVNGAFVFTELFSESAKKILNYGKLRASYASVGNDASAYYNTTNYYATVNNGNFGSTVFPFNGIGGFSYGNSIGNPNLKPEFSREGEVGVELAFLQNRITVDFSYYNKRSENQILAVPIATSSGFSSNIINAGLVTNNGVELAVRATPVRTKDWNWELFGTYTKNNNEVKSIYPGVDQVVLGGYSGMSIVAAVGKPYGTYYTTGHVYAPDGRVVVDSASGIPVVSSTAQYYASYMPKFQASWGTSVKYKNFELYILFDTKQGGQFYSRTRDIMSFVGTSKETESRDPQVWPNSVYMGSDGNYHTNNTQYSVYSYYTSNGLRPDAENLVDASYVKLREARLTYVFPKKWLERTWFGGASASIYGNNLFLWTPSSNKYVDPEVSSNGAANAQGFDFSAQPSVRNYGINVKFTF